MAVSNETRNKPIREKNLCKGTFKKMTKRPYEC